MSFFEFIGNYLIRKLPSLTTIYHQQLLNTQKVHVCQ